MGRIRVDTTWIWHANLNCATTCDGQSYIPKVNVTMACWYEQNEDK